MNDATETMQPGDTTQAACPPWCQPERHTINDDGSVTHEHLFGTVAGIDVVIRRTDQTDDRGKVKHGPTRAFAGDLSMGDLDELHRLAAKAAAFSGQRMNRGAL